ncbi:hypothetical protein ACROYT_G014925 [Oculina patagonica]
MNRSEVELSDSATLTALDLNLDLSDESLHLPTPVEETINVENQPELKDQPVQPFYGPITLEEHVNALKLVVKKEFAELQKCEGDLEKYQAMYAGERVMADVDSIIQLCEGVCDKQNCTKQRKVVNQKLEAGVLTVAYCWSFT